MGQTEKVKGAEGETIIVRYGEGDISNMSDRQVMIEILKELREIRKNQGVIPISKQDFMLPKADPTKPKW